MADAGDTSDAHLDAIEEELHLAVLLVASPHKHGPGKVHVFKDGKTRAARLARTHPESWCSSPSRP